MTREEYNQQLLNGIMPDSVSAHEAAAKQALAEGPESWQRVGNWLNNAAEGIGSFLNKLSGNAENNAFNSAEAETQRQFASAESQKARDFELYMSNTAYQRAVADMRKAGVNPAMLTGLVGSGSPASTGSGNAASGLAASASSSRSSNVVGTLLRTIVSLAILAK